MEARKCDRCGKFYILRTAETEIDKTNVNRLYLKRCISNDLQHVDLCCECKHDLDEWFNKFNKKEEQNDERTEM